MVSKSCADFGLAIERRFARSSAANGPAPSAWPPISLIKEDAVMMEESLHGEYRLSSLDHRHDERRRAGRWYGATAIVRTLDGTAQQEWPLWPLLDVPLTGRVRRRAETTEIAPLGAIRRFVAAIRLWHRRAGSRQELRELSDHMLKDIGLRREDLGYEFAKPFWYLD
jgi:uncharacterized protein YjiS (DUF1127 family)